MTIRLTCVALLLAVGQSCLPGIPGCDEKTETDAPTGPSAQVNVTGNWSGVASDSAQTSQLTWTVTQNAGTMNGTASVLYIGPNATGNGTVFGTVSGSTLTFTISVPAGAFPSPLEKCAVTMLGTAQSSNARLTGTYTGTNSCSGEFKDGQFTLQKPSS